MTAPDPAVEVRVDGVAEPGWLDEVHDGLARLWTAVPAVPEADRLRFETAVIEIAGNVVRHTASGGDGPVRATTLLRVDPPRLEAEIWDDGILVEVDLDPAPVDDLAESGRGIALVQRAVDTLTYVRRPGRNTWRLVRDWSA
ncbi:ATP-binding protein [Cellulomonas sp. Marseille-Q8402]